MFNFARRWLFERRTFEMISSYRTIMLIHNYFESLKFNEEKETVLIIDSLKEVSEYLGIPASQIHELKGLIEYTYYDMTHYFYSIRCDGRVPEWITENRMQWYLQAMADQVKILKWKTRMFRVPVEDGERTTVMDIGCGLMPFRPLFEQANGMHKLTYIGIDKLPLAETTQCKVTNESIEDLLWQHYPEVVFFGNSLHCFGDAAFILQKILHSTVKEVIIVDYKPKSPQGLLLSYHLDCHTKSWSNPTLESLTKLAEKNNRKLKVTYPSSQHQMIKIGPMIRGSNHYCG